MALSSKQLRLVFAKLREKGLLKYTKKGRSLKTPYVPALLTKKHPDVRRYVWAPKKSYVFHKSHPLDDIISKNVVERLLTRVPKKHLDMSYMTGVKIHDDAIPEEALYEGYEFTREGRDAIRGHFNPVTGIVHVRRSPTSIFMEDIGYSSIPAHRPRGYIIKNPPPDRPMFSKPLSPNNPLEFRNAKLGAARVFYHEFAHSLRFDQMLKADDSLDAWRPVYWSGEWHDMRHREGLPGLPLFGPHKEETFAEAYTWYATNKLGRNRLRKERPMSYEFMKKFFEEK